ncbi:glycosyltransferase family 2 protein [Microbulbifer echini]|uniref:Glycosyltransferase family 2 protein n=1 Tax=Microbulbifer echini TaxID=1529067 RepID=A0ABV4NML2_9GAMM
MKDSQIKVSIVIPAKNEAKNLNKWLPRLAEWNGYNELIIIDDGSDDNTAKVAKSYGAKVLRNPQSLGNGASIKRGFRETKGEVVVFMDADGQHKPEDIPKLLETLESESVDMVVGARDAGGQASKARYLANVFYNRFASYVTGQEIKDLTSGFRVVKADKFREFIYLLPNKFSYPTTSTMAFLRAGYLVRYVSVNVLRREGRSHISPLRDGVRFLLIIFKIATLFSPLKVFLPFAALSFLLGLGRYIYTYLEMGVFTNMSALLMVSAVQIFLIGLISEQITALIYKKDN